MEFGAVVGQDKAVGICKGLLATGLGGRAVWITGQSGTGKTTLAKILAESFAHPLAIEELTARSLSVSALEDLERSSAMGTVFNPSGRAFIVNEYHGLRAPVIEAFHDVLERVPRHSCWLFTTTNDGAARLFDDSIEEGPFRSRCLPIALARQGLAKPFAAYLEQHDPAGPRTPKYYTNLIQDCHNNLRLALQRLEADAMGSYAEAVEAA